MPNPQRPPQWAIDEARKQLWVHSRRWHDPVGMWHILDPDRGTDVSACGAALHSGFATDADPRNFSPHEDAMPHAPTCAICSCRANRML